MNYRESSGKIDRWYRNFGYGETSGASRNVTIKTLFDEKVAVRATRHDSMIREENGSNDGVIDRVTGGSYFEKRVYEILVPNGTSLSRD